MLDKIERKVSISLCLQASDIYAGALFFFLNEKFESLRDKGQVLSTVRGPCGRGKCLEPSRRETTVSVVEASMYGFSTFEDSLL